MAPTKASDESSESPRLLSEAKAPEAKAPEASMSPTHTIQTKAPGSSSITSPKPTAASIPRTPPVTTKTNPSGVDPNLKDWVKFGSKLRNQLPESDDEHDDETSPKKRVERRPEFAPEDVHRVDGYHGREETSVRPVSERFHNNQERVDRRPGLAPEDIRNFDDNFSREDTPARPVNDQPYINQGHGEPRNPGEGPHDKFEAISVHTAKCDGCGNHNNKVVQRCKRCNLQYCQPCLRNRKDGRHFANVDLLDWTPKPMIRSKRTNEVTKRRKAEKAEKAVPKAAAKTPKQASRAPTRAPAPTRPPSERVQLAEARRRSINPAGDDAIDPEFNEVPRRRRQHDDDFELIDDRPRKRYYSDDEDMEMEQMPKKSRGGRALDRDYVDEDMEMERMPKKSRGGRVVDREYADEESSEEEVTEARVRFAHDNRRPRDPYEDEMERPASRQSEINSRRHQMGYGPSSTVARVVSREFPTPRADSRAGRTTYMTQDEAIAAAWQQRQEMKRQSERDARLQAARSNPIIARLIREGREEEAEEVLAMAETLTDMSAAKN